MITETINNQGAYAQGQADGLASKALRVPKDRLDPDYVRGWEETFKPITEVIFRISEGGKPVALIPAELEGKDFDFCLCYSLEVIDNVPHQLVKQSLKPEEVISSSRPALNEAKYAKLQYALEKAGYRLRIVTRLTSNHLLNRKIASFKN